MTDTRAAGERRYGTDKHLIWLGSKYDCRQLIMWCVPAEVSLVVSPFWGSGIAELTLLRNRPNLKVEASDLDQAVVTFWQAMLASSNEVAKCVKKLIPKGRPNDEAEFLRMHSQMRNPHLSASRSLTAARFWLVNHLTFSGMMGCVSFAAKQAETLWKMRDARLAHLQNFADPTPAGRLTVTCQDAFRAIAASHPSALLLLDPPYLDRALGTTLSHVQYSCGPNWGIEMHKELQKLLGSHQRWILCHEDMPEIRKLYKGFRMLEYSRQAGGTAGRSVSAKHGPVDKPFRKELLILSHWVAARLPHGTPPVPQRSTIDGACSDCLKCGGRRKATPTLASGSLRHRCPLSGARSPEECVEACAVCNALLPPGRREAIHLSHCRTVWPELWKSHQGSATRAAGKEHSEPLHKRSRHGG